ncbi:MAG TPA: DUF4169 family protein [Pseudorhodoplanes sp.]|jgi:hypothetical protein|nr:DUF4169 family protein [Pseudorhodoplanes sp.]
MGDILNLRTARKRVARQKADQAAEQNRRAFGRSKSERKLAAAREAKAQLALDQHRIGNGESE